MKQLLLNTIVFASLALFVASCSTGIEKKLIGTWKAEDVQTDFNETEVTPEMLAQVVELQKQTYFRFMNDSIMVIISKDNTHEANWTFDEEQQMIMYFFKGMETEPNALGRFEGDQIINESNTPLGKITIYYGKQD